jgi:uncharacterized UPF0146 family protein
MVDVVDSDDIVKFIKNNYFGKVVEIGVGLQYNVAIKLSEYVKVIVSDIIDINQIDKKISSMYVKDDISNPRLSIYKGASLIYSIRPPIEIQTDIINLAYKVGSDALIRPLGSEIVKDVRLKLKNFGKAAFYVTG